MTQEEINAFRLAKDLVIQAKQEDWSYVSLSPRFHGGGALRAEWLDILAELTVLPDEISELSAGVILELRGTKISDLRPLGRMKDFGGINFRGIPACDEDANLKVISEIDEGKQRKAQLDLWLLEHGIHDPPETLAAGPEFKIDDLGPIRLLDFPMDKGDDSDQSELKEECERKVKDLLQTVGTAANVAPSLPQTVERYSELISRDATDIGARAIWSIANSLEAVLQIHSHAHRVGRQSEELPAPISAKLDDLIQTHRVWFLGHSGAREVVARAAGHTRELGSDAHRVAAIEVVRSAIVSDAVEDEATKPAIENIETSKLTTSAGVAALGELEEWAWNFIASISRKALLVAKKPPGGFLGQTIAGYYVIEFLILNEPSLRQFATNVMAQSPLWWDCMMVTMRRVEHLQDSDEEK